MYKKKIKDVSSSNFWDQYYVKDDIGWDIGGVTPIFKDWCDKLTEKSTIFVPGAGNGYDPLYFSKQGHNVLAVDFAEEPVKRMKYEADKEDLSINILKSDLFDLDMKYNNQFDYVIEYTCFCAIDPEKRKIYRDIMYEILKNKGELIGLFFPLNKTQDEGGPPFGVHLEETISLFSSKFQLIDSLFHPLSIAPRVANERYLRFRKK